MSNTPNELAEVFPGKEDKIHELKVHNAHFANLMEAYHELNGKIHRAETDIEPTSDMRLEDLRKRRLAILDEMLPMLSQD